MIRLGLSLVFAMRAAASVAVVSMTTVYGGRCRAIISPDLEDESAIVLSRLVMCTSPGLAAAVSVAARAASVMIVFMWSVYHAGVAA